MSSARSSVEPLPEARLKRASEAHPDNEKAVTPTPSEMDAEQRTVVNQVPGTPSQVESGKALEVEFPEGGLQAYCTVLGAFLTQFTFFGYTMSYAVYQEYYTKVYLTNVSASAVSWIGSVNLFLGLAGGVFTGRLFDRGYFYVLMYSGCALEIFCIFMLSLTKPGQYYQVFLAQGVGLGVACGLTYIPSIAVIGHYFRRRRSLMLTFAAIGSSLGATVHPIMLNNLINGPLGFANGVRASAGLITGCTVLICALMRTRLPPSSNADSYAKVLRHSSRDAAYLAGVIGVFLIATGFFYPIFYIQLDATEHGLSEHFSFYSVVILNGTGIIGRFLSGFIAEWIGVPYAIMTAVFGSGVMIFGLIGLAGIASTVVIGIIYGYFAGMYIALLAPMFAGLSPTLNEMGVRMGVGFGIAGLGGLIGSPISGALLGPQYIWWKGSVFSGIFVFAGLCCLVSMQLRLLARKRQAAEKLSAST